MKKLFSKTLALLLAAALLLPMAACGGTPATGGQVSSEQLALAENVAALLLQEDFAAVYAMFNDKTAAALSADALSEAWFTTVAPLGAYVSTESATGTASPNGAFNTEIVLAFEGGGLLLKLSFDSKTEIQGLWFTYTPLEEGDETGNYTEVEITVMADTAFPLKGLLTMPNGVENPPVIILVHGSGPQDMNETIYNNAPFKDLAHALAEMGVATIRYEKRTYAYPTEMQALGSAITLREETIDDALAAINLALETPGLNHERVYLLGHSQGGMLAPAIAAEAPGLAGFISMAGSLRQLWQIVYSQNQAAIAKLTAEELAGIEDQIATLEADYEFLQTGIETGPADAIRLGLPVGYWRSFAENNGLEFLPQLTMPMLILQGSADFQVTAEEDYPLWQSALAGRENVDFILYDGLNHLFMPTTGQTDVTEYVAKSHVADEVIADIAAFVTR